MSWLGQCLAVPYAGANRGLVALPEIDDNVWVEI